MTNSDLDLAYATYLADHDLDQLMVVVYEFARRVTRSKEDGQLGTIAAWRGLAGYDAKRGSFSAWARSIAKNEPWRQYRPMHDRMPLLDVDDCEDLLPIKEDNRAVEREEAIQRCHQKINEIDDPTTRLLLKVYCEEGKSLASAGRKIGLSRNQVEHLRRKIRKTGISNLSAYKPYRADCPDQFPRAGSRR